MRTRRGEIIDQFSFLCVTELPVRHTSEERSRVRKTSDPGVGIVAQVKPLPGALASSIRMPIQNPSYCAPPTQLSANAHSASQQGLAQISR